MGQPIDNVFSRENVIYRLTHGGSQDDILLLKPQHADLNELMPVKKPPDTSKVLLSPMPGLLISIAVEKGQKVKAGEELANSSPAFTFCPFSTAMEINNPGIGESSTFDVSGGFFTGMSSFRSACWGFSSKISSCDPPWVNR